MRTNLRRNGGMLLALYLLLGARGCHQPRRPALGVPSGNVAEYIRTASPKPATPRWIEVEIFRVKRVLTYKQAPSFIGPPKFEEVQG